MHVMQNMQLSEPAIHHGSAAQANESAGRSSRLSATGGHGFLMHNRMPLMQHMQVSAQPVLGPLAWTALISKQPECQRAIRRTRRRNPELSLLSISCQYNAPG